MEKVIIEIKTTYAAFDDGIDMELARILRNLADRLEAGYYPGTLRDLNGNTVGLVTYER